VRTGSGCQHEGIIVCFYVSSSLLKDFALAVAKAESNVCFLQLLIFIKASCKENLPSCRCGHIAGFSIQTGILTATHMEAVSRAVCLAFLRVVAVLTELIREVEDVKKKQLL